MITAGDKHAAAALLQDAGERGWHFRHDARENDERGTVADAARGDLLAEPNEEHRAAHQRDHGCELEEPARARAPSCSAP